MGGIAHGRFDDAVFEIGQGLKIPSQPKGWEKGASTFSLKPRDKDHEDREEKFTARNRHALEYDRPNVARERRRSPAAVAVPRRESRDHGPALPVDSVASSRTEATKLRGQDCFGLIGIHDSDVPGALVLIEQLGKSPTDRSAGALFGLASI